MKTFQTRPKKQISHAFGLLSSVHNLHISRLSFWLRSEYHLHWDIHKIESLIRKCIPIPQKLYNITRRLKTPKEVEKYFPGFMAFTDCTEQQIPRRPVDNDKRMTFYSGKKKRHTVKTQLMVNNQGIIIYKLRYKKGRRRHDYDVYKENHSVTPKEVVNVFDLGYLGVETDFPEQLSSIPYRKQRNQCLSQEEQNYNTIHSKMRIVVEHTISVDWKSTG